ncbi:MULTISPECIES: lamin tail domain-containing protein [unclassified Lysobacter]|uniref:lamin tail domain-containing protein n=1 Tax=unclassified Lysobacter TaxID=2635362 RepID=UPI001BEA2EFE|nr:MULTISPECIES: lamin tail domain-containing protein [unclassified Lysobacter]MBT2746468.1 lamin tail domain-containing protein [Lysobacter sp. ISL-42]MBT2753635.1 lamin tail domain-containing protein [Lysobacter sp. ISL-50]MBT2779926.1 lamin tail domain-containing protein [Lysobacter sp. ISL-54]MBT2784695.1 lamin tail domain-containing protein [Lysobacter sp. ISL-52]
MNKSGGRLLAAALAFAAAGSAQAEVVISQVYSGGGSAGASFKSDFIELHNNGDTAVNLSGWSVQYNIAASTFAWQRTALSGSIAPGGYYLIKQGDGSADTPALPTPDAIGTIQMQTSGGKVLLVNHNSALTGACPSPRIDALGISTTATCSETRPLATTLGVTTAAARKDGGCNDTGDNSLDFEVAVPAPRNNASAPRLCSGGLPSLTVQDAAVDEGNAGQTAAAVTVRLDRPAGAGGVSFQYVTRDGTATAGSDYVAQTAGSATIAAGQSEVSVIVPVLGDTTPEPNETLFVDLSNIVGASGTDISGQITIRNDDVTITPIGAVQGPGEVSPLNGRLVTIEGIVTGRKDDGFFVQTPDGADDQNPATSEGIFVFVGFAPPAAATTGNLVRVTGTVVEFVPTADLDQAPRTQIGGSPSIVFLTDQTTLPAPVYDNAALATGNLERYEGMRIYVANLTVSGAAKGALNEAEASTTTNGVFYGTTDSPRPFREEGYRAGDPQPPGGDNPQWDFNPELIAVDSDALGYNKLDLGYRTHVLQFKGILDYSARRYTVLMDPDTMPDFQRPFLEDQPIAAAAGQADIADGPGVAVAMYPSLRLFDASNDPAIAEPVLTSSALDRRLSKASLGIRDYLKLPDILGLSDVENLATLQALATRINNDATAAGQANPQYTAHLLEGNDALGLDPGYLVKTADVLPGKPRVEVVSIAQLGKDTVWVDRTGNTAVLNDRPPLVLDAVVHYADGRDFPLSTVLVNQQSADGIVPNDLNGENLRLKRQRQAEFLAGYVNQRQINEPATRLIVLGDFNAPQFNDAYADVVNVVTGTPSLDETTAVPGDGADLVEPNLINLVGIAPARDRYTSTFEGNAQSLDHMLVNETMVAATTAIEFGHARINADFQEFKRTLADSPLRLSDRDPTVAYLIPPPLADLGVAATANAASVSAGQNYGFAVTATNHGPGRVHAPGIGFALDAEVPSLAVVPPDASWTCAAPQIANGKTSVACSAAQLAPNASAAFAVSATATAELTGKSVKLAVSGATRSQDTVTANDAAEASVAITAPGGDATPIASGDVVTGIAGGAGEARVYKIEVPSGARSLRIMTLSGRGDITLYAKRGVPAAPSSYDFISANSDNNELIFVTSPQAGTWFITLQGGAAAFDRVTLRPSVSGP